MFGLGGHVSKLLCDRKQRRVEVGWTHITSAQTDELDGPSWEDLGSFGVYDTDRVITLQTSVGVSRAIDPDGLEKSAGC